MWVRLGTDFLNLDHIFRIRFNKSWNKEGECLVAEIDTDQGGEIRPAVRYRGGDAEALQSALFGQVAGEVSPVRAQALPEPAGPTLSSASFPTLSDL
jgi:hypothetical protein